MEEITLVTNSHATLIQPNECYIYPMANSLRGGAIASEYNIRNLFGVLLSKSSAKTNNDFEANVDESSKWYGKELNINTSQNGQRKEYTSDFELIISPGSGMFYSSICSVSYCIKWHSSTEICQYVLKRICKKNKVYMLTVNVDLFLRVREEECVW